MTSPDSLKAQRETQHWMERAVIGLNLCPFAKAVHVKGLVHFAVSPATQASELLADLRAELDALVACEPDQRETTLLIAPHCLHDFLDFNDFLDSAERMIRKRQLEGVIQLASFHPHYQFADTEADDITNFTNRSPYPTLHLLRESSIDKAVEAFPQADAIFEANMKTMRDLGPDGWRALGIKAAT